MTYERQKFDPKNPTEFKYIPNYVVRNMKQADQKFYKKESAKYEAWSKEDQKRREQAPRDFESEKSRYGRNHGAEENALILRLGNALKKKGFTITYTAGRYNAGEYEIHETWAKFAIVYKDGQRVGQFKCWETGEYWARPIGWKIETNRGKGSNRSSWDNEKRLKNINSAVKYFEETAIPRATIEDELDKAEKTLKRLRGSTLSARNEAYYKKRGVKKLYRGCETDGTMEQIMDAMETGNEMEAMKLVSQQFKEYEELAAEVTKAEEAETDYLENVVQPLRKLAKRAVPEVYS